MQSIYIHVILCWISGKKRKAAGKSEKTKEPEKKKDTQSKKVGFTDDNADWLKPKKTQLLDDDDDEASQ
jgi:hypothetical protein